MQDIVHLVSRSAEDGGQVVYQVSGWSALVGLLLFLVFFPMYVYIAYTMGTVFPIFAILEDENPPAYEPVALDESANAQNKPTDGQPQTVTSSLRSINRILYSNGGWRSYFRGLPFDVLQNVLVFILGGIFSAALGGMFSPIATLLTTLALIQFSTAWVHIVLAPSTASNLSRLPPFKRTFDATWKAATLYWASMEVMRWVPTVLMLIFHFEIPDMSPATPDGPNAIDWDSVSIWKIVVMGALMILLGLFVHIPAYVVLTRVQASLLPGADNAILPFDRSFGGRVQPAVIDGKGYATVYDAWTTFSRAAWRRLLILSAKIFFVTLGFVMVAGNVVGVALFLLTTPVKVPN